MDKSTAIRFATLAREHMVGTRGLMILQVAARAGCPCEKCDLELALRWDAAERRN